MMHRLTSILRTCAALALLCTLALSRLASATAQAPTSTAPPTTAAPAAPLLFVENAGQFPDGARFQVHARDLTLWLAEDGIWLTLLGPAGDASGGAPADGANVKLTFPGANPHPRLEPFNRQATRVSFLTGSDPWRRQAGVPAWGGVRYVDLVAGVDLELTGEAGQIVPRLVGRPGADLGAVRLRVEGANSVRVEGDALVLVTAAGTVTWPLLRVESFTGAPSVMPAGLQTFDVAAPLAVVLGPSPVAHGPSPDDNPADLLYGTFLGGADVDEGQGIAVDGDGSAYVTGETRSSDFPSTPGAFDPIFGGNWSLDAFVAKLSADGSALVYATYLGGSADDQGYDIAVDESGAAYVTGYTFSSDFPTTPGAFDTSLGGPPDAFVVKLNASGSALEYGTYLGGNTGADSAEGIALDQSGAAYVTGQTSSDDFPATPGAFDTSFNLSQDAFVAKLDATGSSLHYATYLGGTDFDYSLDIAVTAGGAACVTGNTWSSDLPTTPGAFDTSFNGGLTDAFAAQLNQFGSDLDYATFLGGSLEDYGYGIAVDGSGAAYVTGYTASSEFPTTPGAFDTSFSGGSDGFVTKLSPTGSSLEYATFLGGGNSDGGSGIAVDGSGAAYVSGGTSSSDFPTTPGAFDTTMSSNGDAFAAKLNAAGAALEYATFLGGGSSDGSNGVAVGESGAAYVTGSTLSSDFPTTPGAFDTINNSYDAFAVKLAMAPSCYAHLWKLKLNWAYAARPGYVKLVASGIVHDQDHLRVAGATVSGHWTRPDGSPVTATAVTDNLGRFKFRYKGPWTSPGTYRIDVDGIQLAGYAYDPGANQTDPWREVSIPPP